MPKYKYTALGSDGATVQGVAAADTLNLLGRDLSDRGLSLLEAKVRRNLANIEITKKKVPRKELMHFSRQLSVFLRAGIPIVEALDVVREETGNRVLRQVLAGVAENLTGGETFANSCAAHPEAFPHFFVSILRSAELTGNLDTVLDQLAEYIDRDLEARRKITSAMVYPAIVFVMSIAAAVVITVFVLPRFETFFTSLGAKLPLPTRILLTTSRDLRWYWYVPTGLLAAIVVSVVLMTTTERGKGVRDRLLLKTPVIGGVVRDAVLERFCRILSAMNRAGVPLPDAMAVTASATNNAVFRAGIRVARESMMEGGGLAGPLAETNLFPAAARQMIRVGENTGSLDTQLETAAIYFDRELEYKLKRLTSLFEPAVILFMGALVGFVAIALVSAMYGIFRQVNVG
jgi:type IV pilus assembly protein PilC